ncbi:flavin reductase [bacterium]|nr:flavin reductase [bacterium]
MRKDFGVKTFFFPLPVLIIGTYDKDGNPNAMNVAWGGIRDYGKIEINLGEHKTTDNLRENMALTIAFADKDHIVEADYFGIVSGNEVNNKIEKAGLTITKSKYVNAPIINEFPVTLECVVESISEDLSIIAKIVNVSAREEYLDEKGNIDVSKLHIISYEPVTHKYIELGSAVGQAFKDGLKLK